MKYHSISVGDQHILLEGLPYAQGRKTQAHMTLRVRLPRNRRLAVHAFGPGPTGWYAPMAQTDPDGSRTIQIGLLKVWLNISHRHP